MDQDSDAAGGPPVATRGPELAVALLLAAIALLAASLWIAAVQLRAWRVIKVFATRTEARQVLTVLWPMVVYVVLIKFIGIYVASALYIALFMVLLGRFDWPRSLGVGLGVCVVFFVMFEVWFKVPLFKGALNPTAFLGY